MAKRLRAGWMVAVVPGGVVVVGPWVEIEIALPGCVEAARAVVAAVVGDGDPSLDDEARTTLRRLLHDHGALTEVAAEPPPPGHSLAAAVSAALRDEPPEGVIWTAEETLVLPPCLSVRTRTRALRAFIAGLTPDGRLEAYALLARGHGAVHGDVPDTTRVAARLAAEGDFGDRRPRPVAAAPIAGARAVGASIAVIDLTPYGRMCRVAPEDLDRIGAGEAHRLGPILWTSAPEPVDADLPEVQWCVAEVAVANLASPTSARDRAVQGVGDPEQARLVAHAEGAERFAAAEVSSAELVRARFDELPGAVDPRSLYARDAATDGTDTAAAAEPRLWTPVTARDGTRRWAPAETAYVSVRDPAPAAAIIPWTSSGLAAGLDLPSARRRAFRELVERDAFMMAWLRRISRERVAPHGAPDAARHMAAVLATRGWTTTWVNLTLDTLPVILCCLTHPHAGLTVGAACAAQPAEALRRATVEALVLALRLRADDGERPLPHEVRTPRDHVLLHRDPARRPDHEFLYTSPDEIDLSDIPDREGEDLEALLDGLGHAPLVADLSLPAVCPYRVVRALAPGLVPLTFGWRTDALGLPRLRRGAAARPGWHPDAPPRGTEPACTVPHPFP
jgi:ribosomal protein S12 methylthiotransferase accessory factor